MRTYNHSTKKRPFALAEVIVALMLLSICASATAPYFQNMYKNYERTLDTMRCEYLVEEQLTNSYVAYLANPPAFDEIVTGKTTKSILDGFTVTCTVEKELAQANSTQPVCTAKITVNVQKGTQDSATNVAKAIGSIELCFQKRAA